MKYGLGAKGLVLEMVYLHAWFCCIKRPRFHEVQGKEKHLMIYDFIRNIWGNFIVFLTKYNLSMQMSEKGKSFY